MLLSNPEQSNETESTTVIENERINILFTKLTIYNTYTSWFLQQIQLHALEKEHSYSLYSYYVLRVHLTAFNFSLVKSSCTHDRFACLIAVLRLYFSSDPQPMQYDYVFHF